MTGYLPGDRVWVEMEGYPWWPARVISEVELSKLVGARKEGCDIAVVFYAGTTTAESVYELNSRSDQHHICHFEVSSEKAVTADADLITAIQNATADSSANALKSARTLMGGSGGIGGGAVSRSTAEQATARLAGMAAGAGAKRGRDDRAEAARPRSGVSFTYLSVDELKRLAAKINEAVAEEDVASLRILLCDLDNVDVPPADLSQTKIGVAVGNILGSRACAALWALCKAIVSFWARHLPRETISAIELLQKNERSKQELVEVKSPMSPGYGSPTFGSPTFAFPQAAGGPPPPSFAAALAASGSGATSSQPQQPKSSFFGNLCRILDHPLSATRFPVETIEQVARELSREVTLGDDRQVLLTRLGNEDLDFVRENLLSRKWSVKQYLEQPLEVFKTQREKTDEERRLRDKIEAEENAKLANVNITETLFTCKSCGKKRCSFYEQQTRGADEPTTKFITCLGCKTTWTEE